MESERIFLKFHPYHGLNIQLQEKGSVAYRAEGFDEGVVLSEKQLQPGELFVVEIEQNENRWTGYLRLGLTQLTANSCDSCISYKSVLPRNSLSNLTKSKGDSWVYGLTDLLSNTSEYSWPCVKRRNNVEITDNYIDTCRGRYLRSLLKNPLCPENTPSTMRDLDVGFKVGVVYVPNNDEIAELFYVINGDLFGPYALKIPYKEAPIYAVVDIYGRTKKVRILQIRADQSLKQLCRLTIRKTHDMKKLNASSLPNQIKNFLNYKSENL